MTTVATVLLCIIVFMVGIIVGSSSGQTMGYKEGFEEGAKIATDQMNAMLETYGKDGEMLDAERG